MMPCERKCFDCGNVAMHADNITPHVICTKCGSQDTRLLKRQEIAMDALPAKVIQKDR